MHGHGSTHGHGHGHGCSGDKKTGGRSPHGKILGTTTVGERGQIVIPAEARAELGIASGDKLVVFGSPHTNTLTLVKADVFDRYAEFFMSKSKKLERLAGDILRATQETNEAQEWEEEAQQGAGAADETDEAATSADEAAASTDGAANKPNTSDA